MAGEKQKMSTGKKVLIGIGVYLAVTAIALAIISQTDAWKNTGAEQNAQSVFAEGTKEDGVPTADAPLERRVSYWLKTVDQTSVKGVHFSSGDDGAEIYADVGTVWNEDRLITVSCYYALDLAKTLYEHCPEYNRISFVFRTTVTDALGNDTVVPVFKFSLSRAVFEKMNYENFRLMVMQDYNSMWNAVENVYIAPDIKKNLKKLTKKAALF
ncbi:MAG: hypothetical protein IJ191_02310 [Treponema sp.]|nr:hypothetical protein [Treponema sp.]